MIVGAVVMLASLGITLLAARMLLVVVPPNRMAVICGRTTPQSDGTVRGYRLMVGGRRLRIPFLEHISWMDLSNMAIPVAMKGVHVQGGDVAVDGAANVKIAGPPAVHNAVERFLDRPREDIEKVALQTLQGAIRQVAGRLGVAELSEDPERLTRCSVEQGEQELLKLGLCLDTLALRVELTSGAPATGAKAATEPAPTTNQGVAAAGSPPWAGKP